MSEITYPSDTENQPPSIVSQAINTALTPLRLLSSPLAIKTYITLLLFTLTSTLLLSLSSTAYAIFYYNFIPPINLELPLYLQYSSAAAPWAVVELEEGTLISGQGYDVEVVLDVPRTEGNRGMGNFMVDVRLMGLLDPLRVVPESLARLAAVGNVSVPGTQGWSVLYHSRRPAILPYESPVSSVVSMGLGLPWHVFGFRDMDKVVLRVGLWELLEFERGRGNVPTHARVEVVGASGGNGREALQSYAAHLRFAARFRGLRFVVYNYRVLSFLVFSMLFYMTSISTMLIGWAAISALTKQKRDEKGSVKIEGSTRVKAEPENGDVRKIKQEQDQAGRGLSLDNISDSAVQYPTGRGRPALQYAGRQASAEEEVQTVIEQAQAGEAADDEDEGAEEEQDAQMMRRFEGSWAASGARFEGDSGIGTSMESEAQRGRDGLSRRRSGRSIDGQK